jgi:hypothetical protein
MKVVLTKSELDVVMESILSKIEGIEASYSEDKLPEALQVDRAHLKVLFHFLNKATASFSINLDLCPAHNRVLIESLNDMRSLLIWKVDGDELCTSTFEEIRTLVHEVEKIEAILDKLGDRTRTKVKV